MSEHGRIITVTERPLGSTLVGDTAVGATTLTVVDAAEFDDQNGGWLSVNDQVIQYDKVDDDTGIITLTTGASLTAAADEGDAILVFDPMYQTIAVDKRADVVLDGADDNTDAIDAGIALHLVDKIDTGVRGDTGESVIVEEEAGDWKIIDVLGLGNSQLLGPRPYEDIFTLSGGPQSFTLTHEPQDMSEDVKLNGLGQTRGIDWTRDGTMLTVTGAMDAQADDELKCQYTYLVGVTTPDPSVGWMAAGWHYLLVAEGDTSDRSGTGFDDSGWSSGRGAFGNNVASDGTKWGENPGVRPWPAPSTVIPVNTGIWLRRPMSEIPAAATSVTLYLRVDGDTTAYWNGTQIGTRSSDGTTEVDPITVPANLLGGSNLLAIHHVDDASDPAADFIYIDARIEWSE